jgi:hypothetical protein
MEANKRASNALIAAREVSAKLFGPRPEESVANMPEMCVSGLTARLISTLTDLEDELGRQHSAIGEVNQPGQVQGRAASY